MRIAAGRDAGRPRARPGRDPAARRRAAVPDHHRGPGQRVPARHRPDHHLPLPRRRRRPARRRHGATPAPRSARTSTRCWPSSPAAAATSRRRSTGPGAPWRSSGSAASPPTSRSCRRCSTTPTSAPGGVTTVVHRGAPAAAHRPRVGRPRHQAADLPRRRHRQPAVRRGAGLASTRAPSCRDVDLHAPAPTARRQPLLRARPRGVRPLRCAEQTPSRSPTRRSATRTSRCSPPGSAPATCSRSPGTSRARRPQLLSLEGWGGATYDVALRFLAEDPWERLAALRQAVPNICLQMLLRGRNTVGYTPYPTDVTDAFVRGGGGDRHRRLPDLRRAQRRRADAARRSRRSRGTGTAVAEVALCYTGDLSDPGEKLYTLDYYLRLAERIVDAGAHVLAIKDMAGLLRAPAARTLVAALRERFDLPVHLHTHDTAGGQLATLLAAIDAGVDAVDAASRVDGRHHQPAAAVRAGRRDRPHRPRPPGSTCGRSCDLEPYWEATRRVYAPFESGLPSPDRPRLRPRDPRRPALQPAPAGDRARPRREVRADRGHVRRRQPDPRQHSSR